MSASCTNYNYLIKHQWGEIDFKLFIINAGK